jgi:hypothetical protein
MLNAVPITNAGTLSKETGTPPNDLINSNLGVVEGRIIQQGDNIAIRYPATLILSRLLLLPTSPQSHKIIKSMITD